MSLRVSSGSRDQPTPQRSDQPLQILNHGSQVRLNLDLGSPAIACSRQPVILFRFGKQTFHFPHPLRQFFPERRGSHSGLHVFEEILIEIAQNKPLRG
jgi:hypothetical protein